MKNSIIIFFILYSSCTESRNGKVQADTHKALEMLESNNRLKVNSAIILLNEAFKLTSEGEKELILRNLSTAYYKQEEYFKVDSIINLYNEYYPNSVVSMIEKGKILLCLNNIPESKYWIEKGKQRFYEEYYLEDSSYDNLIYYSLICILTDEKEEGIKEIKDYMSSSKDQSLKKFLNLYLIDYEKSTKSELLLCN